MDAPRVNSNITRPRDEPKYTYVTMDAQQSAATERRGVKIVDTFAEAFGMRAARVLITAQSPAWARIAAQSLTGFATSVIGCKVEAGIESELSAESTPDLRPGISVLLFGFDTDGLHRQLIDRIGQTILTCPTTACTGLRRGVASQACSPFAGLSPTRPPRRLSSS